MTSSLFCRAHSFSARFVWAAWRPVLASRASFLFRCWDRRPKFESWVLDRRQRLLSTARLSTRCHGWRTRHRGCRAVPCGRQGEEEGRPRADERCSGPAGAVEDRGNPTCADLSGVPCRLAAASVTCVYAMDIQLQSRVVRSINTPGVGKGLKARTGRAPHCLRSAASSIGFLFPSSAESGVVGSATLALLLLCSLGEWRTADTKPGMSSAAVARGHSPGGFGGGEPQRGRGENLILATSPLLQFERSGRREGLTSEAWGTLCSLQPKAERNRYCEATLDRKCPRAVSLARFDGVHLEGEWRGGSKRGVVRRDGNRTLFCTARYSRLVLLRHCHCSSGMHPRW